MTVRVTLLLIIALETLWIGHFFGRVATHYEYLEGVYIHGLATCDKALAACKLEGSGKGCKFR